MFATNVGNVDRIIRIVAGLGFVAAYFLMPAFGFRWVFLVLAAVALFTAVMRTCPLYTLFGFSSCPLKKR